MCDQHYNIAEYELILAIGAWGAHTFVNLKLPNLGEIITLYIHSILHFYNFIHCKFTITVLHWVLKCIKLAASTERPVS